MGQFSWIASDDKKPVLDNITADVYLLIPAKFGGGHYHTNYYDGYGNIGIDVYEAVVDWNKDYLIQIFESKKKPQLEDYSDKLDWFEKERLEEKLGRKPTEEEYATEGKKQQQEYYNRALRCFENETQRAKDYNLLSDDHMKQKYGDEYNNFINDYYTKYKLIGDALRKE